MRSASNDLGDARNGLSINSMFTTRYKLAISKVASLTASAPSAMSKHQTRDAAGAPMQ